ncbi:MAG: bifunctional hydroxymethylpyrimidine kinase/phosphomethylpyrimidine kinase [Spirochaetaceae bacterium]|nr:bifunctional hydroxymethylpyrimidine kinase/phosphomethylpyrimidine kinase [Spirochaetaceae bacterium]
MIKVATIAGSDASGGAGLEADLKTFSEYGLYGMAAVTVIATMDPDNGWAHGVYALPEEVIDAQLKTVFKGVGPIACKTGMLGTEYAVELTRKYISEYKLDHFVLDPVMVCKGANQPLSPELNTAIAQKLLPLAEIATPNLFEASQLAGMGEITTLKQMEEACKIIAGKGARHVFLKGGSKLAQSDSSIEKGRAVDLYYDGQRFEQIESSLIDTTWTHGAGCTTAAAITSGLARGLKAYEAIVLAKKFISESLSHGFPLNQWVGPGNPSAWRKGFGV